MPPTTARSSPGLCSDADTCPARRTSAPPSTAGAASPTPSSRPDAARSPVPSGRSSPPRCTGRSCGTCRPRTSARPSPSAGRPAGRTTRPPLGVVHVGGGHQHGQEQAHAVHHDVAFAAIDVLGVVPAPLLAAGGGVHRLAVHAGRSPRRVRFLLGADLLAEQVVDGIQGTIVPPLVEVAPDGTLGR